MLKIQTHTLHVLLLLCLSALAANVQAAETYQAHFEAKFEPDSETALASIRISQTQQQSRIFNLAAPPGRYSEFTGDGTIERNGDRLLWTVPAKGGKLQYRVVVNHRKGEAYDARMTPDWAVLRLDDLFPPVRVTAHIGARSKSSLRLRGPNGWAMESRYGPAHKTIKFSTKQRNFDRPTGWLAAGELGIRRDQVADRQLVVAAPRDQGLHRLDTMAFLRWTLPRLVKVFPDFPERLLVVGARDDMWRGGLSGPGSLYLHSDRPLISENATSTLLHELVHLATANVEHRDDWLVEGLAEYYSLVILRRSGGISQERYVHAFDRLANWVRKDQGHLHNPSSGANTARAVLLLRDLEMELREYEAGSLDALVNVMVESDDLTGDHLLELAEAALGDKPSMLRKILETGDDEHS